MEAWDIIVIGDGPAALRSAAQSAKHGAKTLLISSSALGGGDNSALDGLAAPIQEMNNRGHREDTIKSGYFLCDQDIVASMVVAGSWYHYLGNKLCLVFQLCRVI